MEKQKSTDDLKIEVGDLFYSKNLPIVLFIVEPADEYYADPSYTWQGQHCFRCFEPLSNSHPVYHESWLKNRIRDDGWIYQKRHKK